MLLPTYHDESRVKCLSLIYGAIAPYAVAVIMYEVGPSSQLPYRYSDGQRGSLTFSITHLLYLVFSREVLFTEFGCIKLNFSLVLID